MKTLIAYYSLTGNNELVAKAVSDELGCDLEKIVDLKERPKLSGKKELL